MDITQLTALWSAFIGMVLPLLIAVINQPRWTPAARAVVTAVVCILAGAVQAYIEGKLSNAKDVAAMVLIIAVSALTFYKSFWKPTGTTAAIEKATSGRSDE